jgi:hypothetical protein
MSEAIKDGGPAFPAPKDADEWGMSLRDYFAANEPLDPNESIGLALAERLAGRPHPAPRGDGGQLLSGADVLEVALFWSDAEAAYRYLRADAMLRARATGKGE